MVFLECALFVNKLVSDRSYSSTVWMDQNRDSHLMYNVVYNIRRWGEAIAEKLKVVELKERDIVIRMVEENGEEPLSLPEEPVFPDDRGGGAFSPDANGESKSNIPGDSLQTVSYAVKMAACILLLEITRFLRSTPEHFSPPVTSASQVSTPRVSITHIDRKISSASIISSDAEVGRGASVLSHPPRLGHFGSSLSVEDAETSPYDYRPSISIEDSGGSLSPKKKRVSVYLRVSSVGGTSGSVSRTTSIRKQPRHVRLADSSGDHLGNQRSPSLRRQRKSAALHTSFYTGSRARRPSIVPNATVGSYHPVPPKYRRKSMGAAVISREREIHDAELSPSLSYSQHHISPSLSGSKAPPNSFFGSALGQKLRRSAQRAFRRSNRQGSRKLYSDQTLSPSSSPGLAARKRLASGRRTSVSGGSMTQSIGQHSITTEETRKQFPWLDVVEHIVLANLTSPESREKRSQACKGLIAALDMVYSSSYDESESKDKQESNNKQQATIKMSKSKSLSTLFAQRLSLGEELAGDSTTGGVPIRGRSSQQTARSTSLPSVRRRTLQRSNATIRQFSAPATGAGGAITSPALPPPALARFSFANMSYAQFTGTFLGATAPGSGEGGIETYLEEESSFPRPYLLAELDKQRRDYMRNEFVGLLHAPLSLLIHAAPILHDSTFSLLKATVWDLLLYSDPELAKTAGKQRLVEILQIVYY